jgi:IS5 family transposase
MVMKREEQTTFASSGFERFSRQTKRAVFLTEMDAIVPWKRLCALIQPHYPTGEGGRPSIPLERMLRIYFLQQWFNLSAPAVEEALYDMASMRAFASIDLGDAPTTQRPAKPRDRLVWPALQSYGSLPDAANAGLAGATTGAAYLSEGAYAAPSMPL